MGTGIDFGLKPIPLKSEKAGSLTWLFARNPPIDAAENRTAAIGEILPFCASALRDPRRKWRQHWTQIAHAFRNGADCLIKDGNCRPFKFAPDSPRRWLKSCVNDLPKRLASLCDFADEDRHYWTQQDIGVWAFLFAVRELSFRHPSFDEDRIESGQLSLNACRFLVVRFFAFAHARRQFHALLLDRFCKLNGYDKRITWARLKQILSGERPANVERERPDKGKLERSKPGRPRKVRWPRGERDLWLALVEPVARLNRWTYADLLRAERIFFGGDLNRDDAPPFNQDSLHSFRTRLESPDAAKRDLRFGCAPEEAEWYERQIEVGQSHAKKMASRCGQIGLELRSQTRRGGNKEPSSLMSIFLMPPPSVPGKRIEPPSLSG